MAKLTRAVDAQRWVLSVLAVKRRQPVDALAEEAGMTVVPGVFLDSAQRCMWTYTPAHRHAAAPQLHSELIVQIRAATVRQTSVSASSVA